MFQYASKDNEQSENSTSSKCSVSHQSPNRTGIPIATKNRFEAISGFSFDDVKIHYNSGKPIQLHALAYTQGNSVYIGPGQEKHLNHELGHVVQQKRGKVKPTAQLRGLPINENTDMEREADKIANLSFVSAGEELALAQNPSSIVQRAEISNNILNVAGEDHNRSRDFRDTEEDFAKDVAKGGYWRENEFRIGSAPGLFSRDKRPFADPFLGRFDNALSFLKERNDNIRRAGAISGGQIEILNKLVANLDAYMSNLDPPFIFPQSDGFELNKEQTDAMKRIKVLLNDVVKSLKVLEKSADYTTSFTAFETATNALVAARNQESGLLNGELKAPDAISADRSSAMHDAANRMKDTKGVWKVGEAHRRDMNALDARQYNLIPSDEFNLQCSNWVSGKTKK